MVAFADSSYLEPHLTLPSPSHDASETDQGDRKDFRQVKEKDKKARFKAGLFISAHVQGLVIETVADRFYDDTAGTKNPSNFLRGRIDRFILVGYILFQESIHGTKSYYTRRYNNLQKE